MMIMRENTEGEYSSIGDACSREETARRGRHLTSATKSNGISITMPYWDERVAEMAEQYPVGQIWTAAMMPEHLGAHDASKAIVATIADAILESP